MSSDEGGGIRLPGTAYQSPSLNVIFPEQTTMADSNFPGVQGGIDLSGKYAADLASFQTLSDKVAAFSAANGIGTVMKTNAKTTSTGIGAFLPWYVWAGLGLAVVAGLLYVSEG